MRPSTTRTPRPKREPVSEAHIRLPKSEWAALRHNADLQARSINSQVLHYVREGLRRDKQREVV